MAFDSAARSLLAVAVPDLPLALNEYLSGKLSPKQFEMRVRRELQEWQRSVVGSLLQDQNRKKAYASALADVVIYCIDAEIAAEKWQVDCQILKTVISSCPLEQHMLLKKNAEAGAADNG